MKSAIKNAKKTVTSSRNDPDVAVDESFNLEELDEISIDTPEEEDSVESGDLDSDSDPVALVSDSWDPTEDSYTNDPYDVQQSLELEMRNLFSSNLMGDVPVNMRKIEEETPDQNYDLEEYDNPDDDALKFE